MNETQLKTTLEESQDLLVDEIIRSLIYQHSMWVDYRSILHSCPVLEHKRSFLRIKNPFAFIGGCKRLLYTRGSFDVNIKLSRTNASRLRVVTKRWRRKEKRIEKENTKARKLELMKDNAKDQINIAKVIMNSMEIGEK